MPAVRSCLGASRRCAALVVESRVGEVKTRDEVEAGRFGEWGVR